MLYVFGNSHAAIFSNTPPCGNKVKRVKLGLVPPNPDHPNMRTVFLGPATAYKLYEHEQYIPRISKILEDTKASKENDLVGLYMGEIDCRVHMPKRILSGEDQNLVVAECVEKYYQNIEDLLKNNWKVIVFATHPTTTDGHSENPEKPHYGTCAFRNGISVEFNTHLKALCDRDNIKFVSIYDQLVDENNITKMEYFVDYLHLSYDKCFPMFLAKMKELDIDI